MTDHCVSQPRARLSRAIGAVFAALVLLSTAGMKLDDRHEMSFVATDLRTLLNGTSSQAFAVNAGGVVVGRSTVGSDPGVFHAFVWSKETGMVDLGTLDDATQSTAT